MMAKTPITNLVVEWIDAGCPVDKSPVDAIRKMEMQSLADKRAIAKSSEAAIEQINKRRIWDRDRKRRARGMSAGQVLKTTIESLLVDSDSINKKKKVAASTGQKSTGQKPQAIYLPPNWTPSLGHYAEAEAFGVPREVVDQAASAMRNWTLAEAHRSVTKKCDWNATFSGTWLRRAIVDWKRVNSSIKPRRKSFGDVMHGRG